MLAYLYFWTRILIAAREASGIRTLFGGDRAACHSTFAYPLRPQATASVETEAIDAGVSEPQPCEHVDLPARSGGAPVRQLVCEDVGDDPFATVGAPAVMRHCPEQGLSCS